MKCPKCGNVTLQTVEDCFGIPITQCGSIRCGYRNPTVEEIAKRFYKKEKSILERKKEFLEFINQKSKI